VGIVSCEPAVVGRYVTVVIPGEKKSLTLCEVEVYGTSVLGMWTTQQICQSDLKKSLMFFGSETHKGLSLGLHAFY
jgi:hypothetical protein